MNFLDFSEQIARGAEQLDKYYPGWEDKIDLDTLNVDSPCDCVAGQIARAYNIPSHMGRGWDPYFLDTVYDMRAKGCPYWPDAMGFQIPYRVYRTTANAYGQLTAQWRAFIKARLDAKVGTKADHKLAA